MQKTEFYTNFPLRRLALLGANLCALLLTLANFKLLATLLTPSQLADYALVITFQSFSTLIISGPARVALIRFYSQSLTEGQGATYQAFASRVFVASTFIVIGTGSLVAFFLGSGDSAFLISVVLALLLGILADVLAFQAGAFNQQRREYLTALYIIWSKFALTTSILVCFHLFNELPIPSLFLTAIILAFIPTLVMPWRSQRQNNLPWLKNLVGFSWVYIVIGLVSWAQLGLPRFFLAWWQGEAEVTQFYLVTQLALLPMMALVTSLNQFMGPTLFRRQDLSSEPLSPWQKEIWQAAALILLIGLAAAGLAQTWGEVLVTCLISSSYGNCARFLGPSFLIYSLFSAAQVLRIYGDQQKRPVMYFRLNLIYPATTTLLIFLASHHSLSHVFLALMMGEVIHLVGVALSNHTYFTKRSHSYV